MTDSTRIEIESPFTARRFDVTNHGSLSTVSLGHEGLVEVAGSSELALTLDASRWRHDIEAWRFCRDTDSCAKPEEWHEPGFDDSSWLTSTHLLPLYHGSYSGSACFRTRVTLPAEHAGEVVTFVLGGFDAEDWRRYRVWLNGHVLDEWETPAGWHDPRAIRLHSGSDAYGAIAFGGDNVLVVEVHDLQRPLDEQLPGEDEHFFFQSWLIDQFVVVGDPYETVDDFAVVRVEEQAVDRLRVELQSRRFPIGATIDYEAADVLRKTVTLVNNADTPLRLLDVAMEDLELRDEELTRGGNGVPVLGRRVFAGLEFPAAMNQGRGSAIRVVQMPGRDIAPGETFVSEPAVVGVAAADDADVAESFRRYLHGVRPRRDTRFSIYSALGWYDFTNPADPLFELSQELVDENLEQLSNLAVRGARFDVYMFDDWWESTDPMTFRRRTFPAGGAAAAERVRAHEMNVGLWTSPVATHWGWGRAPGMEAALTGGIQWDAEVATGGGGAGAQGDRIDSETGEWDWDEVFGLGMVSGPRLCPAAEPLRSTLRDAYAHHARELELDVLKIDGAILHCTSNKHGHRPGRYSFEAGARAVIDAVQAAERERPELTVIWYWGARSPWWLKFGDLIFDKGIKLEAATPSSTASYLPRQSVSLNTDQSVRHAKLIPLDLQDSLGVWLGNVAWANRIGRGGWRDAFVLDLARGSGLMQLWGDLTLLDDDDHVFLGRALAWGRAASFGSTTQIGGDPWNAEPYGYEWPTPSGKAVVLHNPSLRDVRYHLELDDAADLVEVFPFPGRIRGDGAGAIDLKPFEVRALELGSVAADETEQKRPSTRPTQELPIEFAQQGASQSTIRAAIDLPDVGRDQAVMLVVSLKRDGSALYHPAPHRELQLAATLKGAEVWYDTEPHARSYNGPGYPWLVYRMPAGVTWSGQTLRVRLQSNLAADIDINIEALLIDPWWERCRTELRASAAQGFAISYKGR
jgi:hypothetical protein